MSPSCRRLGALSRTFGRSAGSGWGAASSTTTIRARCCHHILLVEDGSHADRLKVQLRAIAFGAMVRSFGDGDSG